MSRRLLAARRTGHGRFEHEWRLSTEAAPAELLTWCRETISGCRRPWGIGHFDLSVDFDGAHGHRRTLKLRHVEPGELWPGDSLQDRFAAVWDGAPAPATVHVSASLFSWGEATYAASS